MPCISFIVPVYNMERLLPRALRSLRAQTLTDSRPFLSTMAPRTAAPRCVHRLLPRMRAFASSTSPTAA